MSAIAGIWRFDGKPDVEADCARMLRAQEIYGPHDGRLSSEGAIAVGRRLFKLLPEDVYDRQPLRSRDGRLTLVADVRLDNRDELRPALDLSADGVAVLCDAEILLACLERWGEGALDRIVGDFAFALWNAPEQKLLLARDFYGRRPLCYHRGRGLFAFASMPAGLHALPEVSTAPNEAMVAEFLALIPRGSSATFFKDIERVEPGHCVTVRPESLSSRCYWAPRRPNGANRTAADYVEGLRHHLDQAVKSRLRGANGTVGSHLSAGMDSAGVAATAARLLAPSGGKVIAFTAVPREGYDGADPRNRFGDEGPLAAATAALYPNIEHVLVRSGQRSPLDSLDRNFFLFGAPALSLCNMVWGFAINNAARERRLNVMLSGGAGNLTISYGGLELLPELLRKGRLIRLWHEGAQQVAKAGMRWRGVLVRSFGPYMPRLLWTWLNETFLGHAWRIEDYSAINSNAIAELDLNALARERNLDFSYRPRTDSFDMRVWVLQRTDSGNGAKGVLAGWGLDVRDPTADKRLVEYCLGIPTEHFLADGVQRALGKRALADRLPQAVLNEKKKGYQAVDWHESLTAARADVAAEIERLADCAPAAKVLDLERMRRLVENWPTGGWETDAVMRPYRLALLRGISAGHFLRKASGANR